jgi:sulfide:quinone oxidoreductase
MQAVAPSASRGAYHEQGSNMRRTVILGGGSGGVVAARRLRRMLPAEQMEIVIVDRERHHTYQPSLLWVMTGKREPVELQAPLVLLAAHGIRTVHGEVERIDVAARSVRVAGETIEYDHLVVALGAEVEASDELAPANMSPWTMEGALALRERIGAFRGGTAAVAVASLPYRCPPAPFEVAFMLRYLATQRGFSDRADIRVLHPWAEPMEVFGPTMVSGFSSFLEQYDIAFDSRFDLRSTTATADGHRLVASDGREVDADLAIVVPPHRPPAVIADAGLATETGWMQVTAPSMRHPEHPEVFGVGDVVAPTLGLGMAGVFAHFQAEHVATQIADEALGTYMGDLYNMVGLCVMDMGFVGAAVWCDFEGKLLRGEQYPDCRMLGGMSAFRSVKTGFEQYWFGNLFGVTPRQLRQRARRRHEVMA